MENSSFFSRNKASELLEQTCDGGSKEISRIYRKEFYQEGNIILKFRQLFQIEHIKESRGRV